MPGVRPARVPLMAAVDLAPGRTTAITGLDLDRLHSATVRSLSGSVVGHVVDVYVDASDEPVLLAVRTGVLSVRQVLVPVAGAVLMGRELLVPVSDVAIDGAPLVTDVGADDDLLDLVLAYWDTRMLHATHGDLMVAAGSAATVERASSATR